MTNRIGLHVQTLGAVALVAQVLIAQGCSSSNPPSMTGAAGTTGSAGTVGSAGTTGAAGTSGAAGAVGSAGAAGTAGATGAGGYGSPACPTNTVAGVALAKGAACAAADPQLCYKTCGPEKAGVKSETCASSALYTEGSCMFDPSVSYSCYKIPAAANTACPLDADAGTGTYLTPQGSQPGRGRRRLLQGLDRGEQDGLLRLPAAERERQPGLELLERHGLALPLRIGLLRPACRG
jgi:hypothetical protein